MSVIEFDNQRFDDLYQKYAGMVFRTAYNFLLNKDDAEDIVQEVFIKYFISNKTFNDDNHEKAWILTVTANLSKNVLRSKSHKNLELDDTIKIVDNKFEKAITNHLDLEEAMKRLTANQRLVIYLFYYEQIPIKNIAKIMIENLEKKLKEQQYIVKINPRTIEKIINNISEEDKKYGARPVRRTIKNIVEDKISEEIINGKIKKNKMIEIEI